MNNPPSRDLDHARLWRDHEFAVSAALCIWANYHVTPTMNRAYKELGFSRDDCNVLIALWLYQDLTASDICFLQGRPRNSISRAVVRLTENGYIQGIIDADDARKTNLSMTDAGHKIMASLIPIFVERQKLMMRRLKGKQQQALHSLLAISMEDTKRWAEDM